MKHFFLIFIQLNISFYCLQAQQENHYTQFMYNKLLINPGYAGARGIPSGTVIYRNQWTGFEGAPKSALASFNCPFFTKRVGFGVTLAQRQIGIEHDVNASLAYSYKVISTYFVSVHLGIMGSVRSHGMDFDKAEPIGLGDPSLDDHRTSDVFGNLGLGVYGIFFDRFYAGLSVPHVYANTIGINDNPTIQTATESQHYYAMGGGIFPLSEDLSLMPAVLLKYVKNAPFDADINLNLDIRKKVTTGVSYRLGGDGPGESIDLLAFWQVSPRIGIGGAYDLTLSGVRNYTAGSMEFLVQFDLVKVGKLGMSNPRFFL